MPKTPPSRAIRVLIVEDNEDARDMYVLSLEFVGIEAKASADVLSAFELAVTWQPDVIVTDFLLRGDRNGAELCDLIRSDERTSHIPTLVVTGSTRRSDVETILAGACADIRLKPYLPDALVADVRRLATA